MGPGGTLYLFLPTQIMEHYGVPTYHDTMEFLAHLARRQGKLRKGGLPDHEKAARAVLSDWTRRGGGRGGRNTGCQGGGRK